MSKIWFITGSSRGFGRRFAEAALSRGDKVAATARNTDSLADLVATHGDAILPVSLDVTDKAAVTEAVKQAHEHFGHLDIVVNNAGFGLFGMVEELTEDNVRAQFETNVFGALWVTQAALPYLRAQGSGHIINVSSLLGLAAFPMTAGYTASKAAIEGSPTPWPRRSPASASRSPSSNPAPSAPSSPRPPPGPNRWPPTTAYGRRSTPASPPCRVLTRPHVGPALLKVVDADNPRCGSSSAPSRTRLSRRSTPSGSRPGRSGPRCPPRPGQARAEHPRGRSGCVQSFTRPHRPTAGRTSVTPLDVPCQVGCHLMG